MTNPQQALLQQLHDIHLPIALSKWDWAPGWYVILGLFLIGAISVLGWIWCWYQHGKVKRAALRLLAEYEKSNKNTSEKIAAINELLKRVALVYFPKQQVAALYGKNWLQFLQNTSKKLRFLEDGKEFLCGPYQPESIVHKEVSASLPSLFYLARGWISQRRKPCLK